MDYISLIFGFIAGACGSLVLWITIGRRMMLKYAGESVINAILSPNDDTKRAIDALFAHFWRTLNEETIDREFTDKEGNVAKTKVSPLYVIMEQMAAMLWTRIRGSTGAIKAEQNRIEQGLMASLGGLGGIPIPRKGQTTTDFVMEQLAARLMPSIEQKISTWIENRTHSPQTPKGRDGW